MKKLIFILIVVTLFSCTKEDVKPVNDNTPIEVVKSDSLKIEIVHIGSGTYWDVGYLNDVLINDGYITFNTLNKDTLNIVFTSNRPTDDEWSDSWNAYYNIIITDYNDTIFYDTIYSGYDFDTLIIK